MKFLTPNIALIFLLLMGCFGPELASAQDTIPPTETNDEAGQSALSDPVRKFVSWNEYDGKYFSIRAGAGFLYEITAFKQDEESRSQFDLDQGHKMRDFRFILKGTFKFKKPIYWSSGIMYDGANEKWLVRETGITIPVKKMWGNIFIGRTKEGFSLNKVMVGYNGWTMERGTMNDAFIPILADGIKWMAYLPKQRILWNIGAFHDYFSEGQSFSSYDYQFIGRLMYLPVLNDQTGEVMHIGINGRWGQVNAGKLQVRSRPEDFIAPYFVDSGKFAADHTTMGALECYYRKDRWLVGSEYFVQQVSSAEGGNPFFHGGEIVTTYMIARGTRVYNKAKGIFNAVTPGEDVYTGGPGCWEAVLRFSYIDLDDANITGGKFWRITPMVNWYMSEQIRLEFCYGYGVLNRFNETGATQFYQARIQLQF